MAALFRSFDHGFRRHKANSPIILAPSGLAPMYLTFAGSARAPIREYYTESTRVGPGIYQIMWRGGGHSTNIYIYPGLYSENRHVFKAN
jgi:hypothetical protein